MEKGEAPAPVWGLMLLMRPPPTAKLVQPGTEAKGVAGAPVYLKKLHNCGVPKSAAMRSVQIVLGSLGLSCTEKIRPLVGMPLNTPLSARLSPMTLTDAMPANRLVWSPPPPPHAANKATTAVLSSAIFHFLDVIVHLFACL